MCYAWYTKKEFNKLLNLDKSGELHPTYESWFNLAQKKVASVRETNMLLYVFHLKMDDLEVWLGKNCLENTAENRKQYMKHLLEINVAYGFDLKEYRNFQMNETSSARKIDGDKIPADSQKLLIDVRSN